MPKPKEQLELKEIDGVKESDASSEIVQKTCFIIMPIADHPDYSPGHFARVYKHIITPACQKAGFKPTLATDVKSANFIIADILKRILNADMAICDLSSRNPNVLYELGIRQSFDMPVALIKDDTTRETFDIQGIRYLEYDKELRIDLVQSAVDALAEVITETYENKDKDVFSLVQILGRGKATIKDSNISSDTLAILEAINELGRKEILVPSQSGNVVATKTNSLLPVYNYRVIIARTGAPFDEFDFFSQLSQRVVSAKNGRYNYITKVNGQSEIELQFQSMVLYSVNELMKALSNMSHPVINVITPI